MHHADERTEVGKPEYHVVAGDRSESLAESPPLAEQVWHQGQCRPPGIMVGLSLMPVDDDAVDRREDGAAEADELVRRLRTEQGSRTGLGRAAPTIHTDKVDGESLPEQIRTMARDSPGGTVLNAPPSGERQRENDPARCWGCQSFARIAAVYAT